MLLVVEDYDTSLLGELLAAKRAEASLSVDKISSSTGLSPERIEAVEKGQHDLDDAELQRLLVAYDQAPSTGRFADLVVEVNLDAGLVSMKKVRRRASDRPAADSNLLSYLSLVYQDRELPLGAELPIRSIDLSLLRPALAIRRPEVEIHLGRLIGDLPVVSGRNKSILAVAVGLGIAVASGALILVPASASDSAQPDQVGSASTDVVSQDPGRDVDPRLEVGTAIVIERTAPPADAPGPAARSVVAETATIEIGTAQVIERTPEQAKAALDDTPDQADE